MIRVTDQYFWNFVFTLLYLVLLTMGVIILETEARMPFNELTLMDFALLTLASWRLIRLFVDDTVTKFIREQFWDVKKVGRGHTLEKPKTGPRRTLADLFSCTWCISVWVSSILVFCYLLTPYAEFPVILLAISALAAFMSNLSKLIVSKTN